MAQIQKTLQQGPLDGHKVWVNEDSYTFCFSSGEVYAKNKEGEWVYSEWQSKALKLEINEMLAGRKVKRRR